MQLQLGPIYLNGVCLVVVLPVKCNMLFDFCWGHDIHTVLRSCIYLFRWVVKLRLTHLLLNPNPTPPPPPKQTLREASATCKKALPSWLSFG